MHLASKNVVYLGGFGGIGRKCCQELLGRQLNALAIFDLTENKELLDSWSSQGNTDVFYQKVNITEKSEIEAAYKATIERIGHIDVVINGFGLMDDRYIELTMNINLLGVIYSTLTALSYMDKSQGGKGGLIMNISSVLGLQPAAVMSVYSAAKAGVLAFTKALANPVYHEHNGVSFITICPGITKTELIDDIEQKSTFSYGTPGAFHKIEQQSPEICAVNMVKAIEHCKNGAVWMLDVGQMTEVNIPKLWTPVIKK